MQRSALIRSPVSVKRNPSLCGVCVPLWLDSTSTVHSHPHRLLALALPPRFIVLVKSRQNGAQCTAAILLPAADQSFIKKPLHLRRIICLLSIIRLPTFESFVTRLVDDLRKLMSLLIMPTEAPSISRKLSLGTLSPTWTLNFRRKSESKSPSRRPSSSQAGGLLVPDLTSRSTSDSEESRSTRSNKSRSRPSFKDMMNRLRSSSNVTLLDEALQESDFKQIDDWHMGFKRYSQLVTIQVSSNDSYAPEDFSRICSILTKNCGGRFLHGLPEAVFDFALLWCPASPMTRKEDSDEPSWSWTGWNGPVNFPFDPTNSPDLQSMPRIEGEWFRSEIKQYHIGSPSAPYTVRREKLEQQLRIHYPPYFHAPRGYDADTESDSLQFSAFTISANGFRAEQLKHDKKSIPCSHLINKDEEHCGVIMDFEESIATSSPTGPFEFVLVSRNVRREPLTHTRRPVISTVHPPNTPIWDGARFIWDQEVVDYDENVFAHGPWKVLNVILIKWVGDYAERVAVARIHEDAWLKLNPVKKEILLR